jgi:hypothetical protein
MKITRDKIAVLVARIVRGGHTYRSHGLIHPDRDWLIGFGCFIVLSMGAGWWAATLHARFTDPTSLVPKEVASEAVTFRPAQIEAALEALTAREARYQAAESILRQAAPVGSIDRTEVGDDTATTSETIVVPANEATAAADDRGNDSDRDGDVLPANPDADVAESSEGVVSEVPALAI